MHTTDQAQYNLSNINSNKCNSIYFNSFNFSIQKSLFVLSKLYIRQTKKPT